MASEPLYDRTPGSASGAAMLGNLAVANDGAATLDAQTRAILEQRRVRGVVRRRGWLVRRMLALADIAGLSIAFVVSKLALGDDNWLGYPLFALTLPGWIVLATLYGLYERDEERAYHTTVDDLVDVFNVVTAGLWITLGIGWATGLVHTTISRFLLFWVLAIGFVTIGRGAARAGCRRTVTYLQNTIVVGAGEVGQLVARKLLRHPEYGMNLVGFVDAEPMERHPALAHLALLGSSDRLPEIVRDYDIERVVIAFSKEPPESTLEVLRALSAHNVQIDIVPRLFEIVGPSVDIHAIEGLPIIGLPQARLSRRARLIKRSLDLIGATVGLLLAAPLFALIAIRIKHDSPGPVFFRQTRLTTGMREFTVLKFRTMEVGTPSDTHLEYIKASMDPNTVPTHNGLFKADQADSVTRTGRWLRRASLDELPQLINVLRGEMSLVGPRPAIAYETEYYLPHHFERFLVPAGMTGLWQVTARAQATLREALDMDVAYARSWSLGLDLRLILQTPVRAFLHRGTA